MKRVLISLLLLLSASLLFAQDFKWHGPPSLVIARYGDPTYGGPNDLVYASNGATTTFTFEKGGLVRITATATPDYAEEYLEVIRSNYGEPEFFTDKGRTILVFTGPFSIVRVYHLGKGHIQSVMEPKE